MPLSEIEMVKCWSNTGQNTRFSLFRTVDLASVMPLSATTNFSDVSTGDD
jgi:hypothetical protein